MSKDEIKSLAPTLFREADIQKYGLILFEFRKV